MYSDSLPILNYDSVWIIVMYKYNTPSTADDSEEVSAVVIGAIAGGVGGGMVVLIAIILSLITVVLFLKRKDKSMST